MQINSGRQATQGRIETCRNNSDNAARSDFLRRDDTGRVRGSDWQMPAFNPGMRRLTSFTLRTETKISGSTRALVLSGAARGSRHVGMTIVAQTPSQTMRRRMPAEEVKKDLKQDDYFNRRLAHATSRISRLYSMGSKIESNSTPDGVTFSTNIRSECRSRRRDPTLSS